MTVRAAVALAKRVPAGVGVSYGHTYTTGRETTLALVPVGYADGVPRRASNRGPVLAGGARRTIAGRVCMDQFVLDVGDAAVAAGDEVVLLGPGRPRRADRAGVGRRRRHHPLRAGHPGRRPVRPRLRRLGGAADGAAAPAGARAAGIVGGLVGLAAAGAAAGVGVAGRRRRVGRRVRSGRARRPAAADLRGRPARPARAADRTALVQRRRRRRCSRSRRSGRRDAPLTVVFVHGYTLSTGLLALPAAHPAPTARNGTAARLVFYDQRGHGASGRGAAGALDHRAARPATSPRCSSRGCPRGPVVLVGHSMGGMTIMGLAASTRSCSGAGRRRRADLHVERQPGRPSFGLPGLLTRRAGRGLPGGRLDDAARRRRWPSAPGGSPRTSSRR